MSSFLKVLSIFFILTNYTMGQSSVLIMSPEPDSKIAGDNILIAASFIGISDFDPNSIKLLVDGIDLTDKAYIDSDMISYTYEDIELGNHRIDLIIDDNSQPTSWNFVSLLKDSDVSYSGRIKSSSSLDQVDDQSLNINKLTIDFKTSAYNWIDIKTNIKMTSQENVLYQPRNIYGLNIGLNDIVTLKLGDSNPRISNYTINGKRIRGLDLNFKLGLFNFHYLQGEINRSVQGGLSNAYTYDIDTDDNGEQYIALNRSSYTFKQNLSSARLALGRGELFQWGVSYMKARDDTNSVDAIIPNAEIIYSPGLVDTIQGLDSGSVYAISELGAKAKIIDSKNWSGTGPKDNLVVSSDLGMNLFDKRLRLDGEVAFSMTNNNIWGGPLTLAGLDTLIDDSVDNKIFSYDLTSFNDPADYEKYLIINSNLSPLVPIDINAFGDSASIDLMDAIFSMPSLAYRGRAVTNFYGNYLAVEYSQVGPEFNSLANPYLVKNKREWSIVDKIKLFNNRLMLNVGYKYQDDDIMTSVQNVISQNTISFGFNGLPGPGLPTINFTFRSINRENGITDIVELTDTSYTDNRDKTYTSNIMLNLNHRFAFRWDHSLSGTFVIVEKQDQYSDRLENFVDPSMLTRVINFSISTRYNIPLETTFNITTNSSELSTGPGERGVQDFLTINFNGRYPFLQKKILASGGLNYANGSGMVDMSWLGFKSGLRLQIFNGLSINTQAEFRSKETSGLRKNTIIARANLEYSF